MRRFEALAIQPEHKNFMVSGCLHDPHSFVMIDFVRNEQGDEEVCIK